MTLTQATSTGQPYPTRLEPPPADVRWSSSTRDLTLPIELHEEINHDYG